MTTAKTHGPFQDNRIYFDGLVPEHGNNEVGKVIFVIEVILMRNPSAVVTFDEHCGSETALEESHDICEKIGMTFGYNVNRCLNERMQSRLMMRFWGTTVTAYAIMNQDAHGKKLREGKGRVEIFFRMHADLNSVALPPRRYYYSECEELPAEHPYSDLHDFMVDTGQDVTEERFMRVIKYYTITERKLTREIPCM